MDAKIPIFFLELDKEGELKYGVQDIALVDSPAYQENFFKFKDEQAVKFSIQNEEQRIVTGPVMIPDKLVYRELDSKPFYVVASKETIYDAVLKFSKENRNLNMKASHEAEGTAPGVFIFESFIKDPNRVQDVKGFESLPDGTWFITCKIENDQVWSDVKTGQFNGFSLEALFKLQYATSLTDSEVQMVIDAIGN